MKKQPVIDFPLTLEWRTPAELSDNLANWRTHPESQTKSLAAAISEVGWAGAALFNRRTNRLVDGHARKKIPAKLLVDGRMPVLVGDWSEEQERLILATLDPIAGMAEADNDALGKLLAGLQTDDAALRGMLDGLAAENQLIAADGEDLPSIEETTDHSCVLRYAEKDIGSLKDFLGVDDLPPRLGKAIYERIKAIAATGKNIE